MTEIKPISIPEGRQAWEAALEGGKLRDSEFTSLSGSTLEVVYGPEDACGDPAENLGWPGQFPFTRGVHPSMYRGRLWTMRQFAGLALRGRPTSASSSCSIMVRPVCPWLLTFRP